eukprot:221463-Pelagomonas_calceolata.AAC.1
MAILDVQFLKLSCLAGVVLFLTSSLRLILRSTQCEGQGVTKIVLGRLVTRNWCRFWIAVKTFSLARLGDSSATDSCYSLSSSTYTLATAFAS